MGAAAQALGIPQIEDALLPVGARELRISDSFPMVFGRPTTVVRIVEQAGAPAVGQLLLVWMERRDRPPSYRATACTPWAGSLRSCVFVSDAELDWPTIAAKFEALEAWTIDAPCESGSSRTLDAGSLGIARLAGDRASFYGCNAPASRGETEAGRIAMALYSYYLLIAGEAEQPPSA
ncbi:MAG TPA: hypothetical protein VFK39_12750 [Gemmatimonadaceae bacterium]|nr:hypothetical protein [Gemmatimonadaceae bacterium]